MLTHFIVSDDVERSRRFYTEVLGGEIIRAGEPSFVALANSWIIINVGGGPTREAGRHTYADWRARGAESSRRRRTAEPRSAAMSGIRMGV